VKKLILLLAVSITVSMILSSCGSVRGNTGNADSESSLTDERNLDDVIDMGPVNGGTLKLFSTTPDTLNPVLSSNAYVQEFSSLVFESLVKLDREMTPIPELAKSWEVSEDGLTWTFQIRENVQWHDRMKLTADDVEFTMSVILDSKVDSVYKGNLENISSFSALNEHTIKVVLKSPYSYLAEMMTFPILPRHYFYGDEISNLKSARNMKPVGTGPYRYVSSNNTIIKLNLNEDWWGGNSNDDSESNLPYIPEVEIKLLKSVSDAMNALQTRDIDILTIDADSCSKYTGRSDIIIKKYPGRNYEFLTFNLSGTVMKDPSVRRAIAQAIDEQKLINDVIPGEAVAADMPAIPDTWMYDTNIISIKPDPVKARQLLIGNGWRERRGGL
jgi:peptide/nickel transport system substrate-binding protein